jgi:hypothetical protein
MVAPSGQKKLSQLLAGLADAQVIPQAAPFLRAGSERILAALRDSILEEITAFQTTGNPEILPGLALHVRAHVEEILRLFSGHEVGDYGFVRDHAQLRAEQRFPLEVTLHAYRCGHRILSLWLREATLAATPPQVEQAVALVADFSIEYTNTISIVVAAEYVARTRLIAEAEGDQRTELLSILLSGYDESDGRVAQLLKRSGYLAQRQAYCVAVIQPVHPAEMDHPDRAHRIIAAVTEVMEGTSIRVLAGVRNNLVAVILSDLRRQSGWTAARSNLAERVLPLLDTLGTSVLTGISADHPSTAFLAKALNEAVIALEFADVTSRTMSFAGLPLRSILLRRGGDGLRDVQPPWVERLRIANAESSGALVATLRAIADSDMNVQKAARMLGKHPNTLYARLTRLKEITGLDGQRYHDLTELMIASDCWRV